MSDGLVIIGLSSLIGILIIYLIVLRRRLFNMSKMYVQASMNVLLMQKEFENVNNLYGNDEFIQFLSTTREHAFQYIEEVQEAIKQLQYATMSNNQFKMKLAYQNLLKHLPKEEPKSEK